MDNYDQIGENIAEVTIEEINEEFHKEIDIFSQDLNLQMAKMKQLVNNIIIGIEIYESIIEKEVMLSSPAVLEFKLNQKRDLIYKDFFELQNLFNSFIYQKIIMTYVHIDDITGEREIRLFDNNISHIQAETNFNYGKSYTKLSYDIDNHYKLLRNSLPKEDNQKLQQTASEVEARYVKYKRCILWKINNEWHGYRLNNRGPINEAFVDFYIKEIKLYNELMENIHYFMTSVEPRGVIQADNSNGFLIGDISIGGLQFAVKGIHASPQNYKMIVEWLKKIRDDDFSSASIRQFIERFKEEEQERATKLVKPMLQKSISAMVRYHGEKLLQQTKVEKINKKLF